MKKDIIYNFKSLFVVKNKIKFLINNKVLFKYKMVKINNCLYLKDRNDFPITKVIKTTHTLKTFNPNQENRIPVLINHTIFQFYIDKYKFSNKYLINNIKEFYRMTKVFVEMFNKKYGNKNHFDIEINHDVVFSVLKYNENQLNDLNSYKKEKIENIFSEELFSTIRRL